MKNELACTLAALIVAGSASLYATSAMAAGSDAFNRNALGPNWVSTAGTLSISSHQLVGTTGSVGYLKASSKDTAASAIVFANSTDLEYGAVAIGNIGGGNNAFVKIQAQNGNGTFDHAAFYTGNNGGGNFFALPSAVPSPAVLDVFFCGTVATLRITSAAGVQVYTNDYGTTFGAGGGLGAYGSVGIDNYVGFKTGCADVPRGAPARAMPHDADKSLAK